MDVCRGCLVSVDSSYLSQYSEKLRRQFIYSTGVQVKQNDIFKFQLCKDCILAMQFSCKFKKKCRTSDKIYKNYMMKEDELSLLFFKNQQKFNNECRSYKENDNASTSPSASILNFMKDILDEDELVTTEARIINEVVREDMDILDDSLDSRWLQDDDTTDLNLQLDKYIPFVSANPIEDVSIVPKNDLAVETMTTMKEDDTKKCRIDSNLTKAINSNNEQCLLEKLLLTPSVTSTPKTRSIGSELERIIRNMKTADNGSNSEIKHIVNQKGGKTIKIMQMIKRKNLELSNSIESDDGKSFNNLDDIKSISTQGALSANGEIEKIIRELKEYDSEFADKPKTSGKQIQLMEAVMSKDGTAFTPSECLNIDNDIYMKNIDQVEHKKLDMEIDESHIEEVPDIIGYETTRYTHIHGDPWSCEICKKVLSNQKNLEHHYAKDHKLDLIVKRKYPKKASVCKICGKVSSHPSNAKRHELTHNKETAKSWKCSTCGIEFKLKIHLTLHMSSHEDKVSNKIKEKDSNVYKFVCTKCGYRASTKSNLNMHIRRHEKDFKYFCNECDKKFYKKADLTYHMRLHTGDRPYQCKECPAKFNRCDNLVQHSRKHNGERPYICDVCYSTYPSQNHLKYHKLHLCLGHPDPETVKENTSLTTITESHNNV